MNRSTLFIVPLLLILIIAVAEMATAIYAPSLAMVAEYFQVTERIAQWTVSINLLGLALSGPIYGPWSDCSGRRKVLLMGMGLFLVGSVLSLMANTIEGLLLGRFIQGLGAGVAVVVAFAAVRDLFDERNSAKVLPYMGMAIALSPGLAPILGGYLSHHYGWKMCFLAISGAAGILQPLLFFWMPETLEEKQRSDFSLKTIGRGYLYALQNTRFLMLALIPGLMIGGLWAWMATLPVFFVSYLDVPLLEYGYYGLSGVAFYVLGTFINSRLVNIFSLNTLLFTGLILSLISAGLLMGAGALGLNTPLIFQGLFFPFALGLALILPNGTALAFSEVSEGLGTSSAILGSLEMALGALGVFLAGYLFDGTIFSIAGILLGTTVLSIGLYYCIGSKKRKLSMQSGH